VRPAVRAVTQLLLLGASAASLHAQAADDGLLMPRRTLSTGVLYTQERWNEYWEGTLLRRNGNIGTLTTRTAAVVAHYGLTDRLTAAGMLPYVWTASSQGTLAGSRGVQDVTVALKYRVLDTRFTERGTLSGMVVAEAGAPASGYTPDFLPFSIGMGARRASGRFTLHFESTGAWFIDASAARTWRDKVKLDRAAYYTDGRLYLTNEVAMPDVVDWKVSTGFRKKRMFVPISIVRQRTLGGGDIRRQDMPFLSNRMDFTKANASLMYGLTVPTDLAVQVGVSRTLNGRNVGRATAITAGVLHTFHF
jgi:hypothetical protein